MFLMNDQILSTAPRDHAAKGFAEVVDEFREGEGKVLLPAIGQWRSLA
jgi:hypothetical protein